MGTKVSKSKTKKASKKKTVKKNDAKQPASEQQIADLKKDNDMRTVFHLNKVKETTGQILQEDLEYCLSLAERIEIFSKSKQA